MRVVAMFRVSTDRQAELGASLDAQERRFHELAALNGWQVVAEFRGSESAMKAGSEREVLQNVLECIRNERPDMLYVHEQSRLTRGDDLEVALLLRELKERNIKVCVNGAVRDLASIDERFMFGIQSLVDRTEAERIRERIVRGKREKARQGKRTCGIPPFGYRNPPPGDPKRGFLQIVPEQAMIIRRIYEMAAAGVGPEKITRTLNHEGIASPRGSGWVAVTVCYILRNAEYVGTHATGIWSKTSASKAWKRSLTNPRAIIVENAHDAIISRELWDRVQSRLPAVRSRAPRLLSGLLYLNGGKACGELDRSGPGYFVLHASGLPRFLAREIEPAIWKALSEVLVSQRVIEACIRQASGDDHRDEREGRIKSMEAKLGKLRGRNQRLLELRMDNEISRDEFARQSETLKGEIAELESGIATLRDESSQFDPGTFRRALAAAQVALAPSRRLDPVGQRRFLLSILRRIDVTAHRRPQIRKSVRGKFVSTGRQGLWEIERIEFAFAGASGKALTIPHTPVIQAGSPLRKVSLQSAPAKVRQGRAR